VGGIVGGAGVGSGVGEAVSRAGAFTARVGTGGKDCGRADGEPVLAVGTGEGRAGATVIPGVAGLRVGGALGGAVGDVSGATVDGAGVNGAAVGGAGVVVVVVVVVGPRQESLLGRVGRLL